MPLILPHIVLHPLANFFNAPNALLKPLLIVLATLATLIPVNALLSIGLTLPENLDTAAFALFNALETLLYILLDLIPESSSNVSNPYGGGGTSTTRTKVTGRGRSRVAPPPSPII